MFNTKAKPKAFTNCLLAIMLLALAGVEAFAGAKPAVPHEGHLLEVHGGHAGEALVPRFCWLVVGAVIAYAVYRAGESLRSWIETARGAEADGAEPPKNGLQGIWQTLDQLASLVFPEDPSGKIHCLRGPQGFLLVPDTFDPVHGTATGRILCAAGGHEVGTFALRPADDDPNKLLLVFNDDDEVGIFGRPD